MTTGDDVAQASVDVRGGSGVHIDGGNARIVSSYNGLTWMDGVAAALAVAGAIESPPTDCSHPYG
jgi:hypothetical protein